MQKNPPARGLNTLTTLTTHLFVFLREPRPLGRPQQHQELRGMQKNPPARGLNTLTTLTTHLFVVLREPRPLDDGFA
jgi:hypothetical protein